MEPYISLIKNMHQGLVKELSRGRPAAQRLALPCEMQPSLALRLGIRDDFEGLLLRRADLRLRGTLSRHIAGGTADNHCNDYR